MLHSALAVGDINNIITIGQEPNLVGALTSCLLSSCRGVDMGSGLRKQFSLTAAIAVGCEEIKCASSSACLRKIIVQKIKKLKD